MDFCGHCGLKFSTFLKHGKCGCVHCVPLVQSWLFQKKQTYPITFKKIPNFFYENLRSLTQAKDFEVVSLRYRISRNLKSGFFPFYDSQLPAIQKIFNKTDVTKNSGAAIFSFGIETFRTYSESEDHLRMEWIYDSFSEQAITNFDSCLRELQTRIQNLNPEGLSLLSSKDLWAYKPKIGWINSCPTNWGRGDRLSVILRLHGNAQATILTKLSKLSDFGIEFALLSDGTTIGGGAKSLGVLTKISVKNVGAVQKREFFKILSLLTLPKTSTV